MQDPHKPFRTSHLRQHTRTEIGHRSPSCVHVQFRCTNSLYWPQQSTFLNTRPDLLHALMLMRKCSSCRTSLIHNARRISVSKNQRLTHQAACCLYLMQQFHLHLRQQSCLLFRGNQQLLPRNVARCQQRCPTVAVNLSAGRSDSFCSAEFGH